MLRAAVRRLLNWLRPATVVPPAEAPRPRELFRHGAFFVTRPRLSFFWQVCRDAPVYGHDVLGGFAILSAAYRECRELARAEAELEREGQD